MISNIAGMTEVLDGTEVTLTAQLEGFENDQYVIQWQYTPDGGTTVFDADGANEENYTFFLNEQNVGYMWRIRVTLLNASEDAGITASE